MYPNDFSRFQPGQRVTEDGRTGTIIGIDDGDETLLVDVGAGFSETGFPVTRGARVSPTGEPTLRWMSNRAVVIEAAQPEPLADRIAAVDEAPDDATIGADPYAGDFTIEGRFTHTAAQAPGFRITVTIEAGTQEGYQDALATLAEGVL